MKRLLKAYTSFTRTERTGIIVLLSIIILLIALKATMHLWVHPSYDKEKETQLVKSWESFKAQSITKPVYPDKPKDAYTSKATPANDFTKPDRPVKEVHQNIKLFNFDPNTVDSPTLRRLGLREKTISIFLHWRAKGKKFYHKEEFKKVYTLTPEEYERLEPYIRINNDNGK